MIFFSFIMIAQRSDDRVQKESEAAIRQAFIGITLFVGVATLYFRDFIAA